MPYGAFDTFIYGDGNLATVSGGDWTKLSGFADLTIVDSDVTGTAATASAAVRTTYGGSLVHQFSNVGAAVIGDSGGPTVYSDNADTFYVLDMTATTWTIRKCVVGVFTDLEVLAVTWGTGHACSLEIKDGILIPKLNWVPLPTVIFDSAIPSGTPGIFIFDTAMSFFAWTAGDAIAPQVDPVYQEFPKAMLNTDIPVLTEGI